MNQYMVVAHLKRGMIVKAVGLTWDAAHDLRDVLQSTGIYQAVSVGAVGAYFYQGDSDVSAIYRART